MPKDTHAVRPLIIKRKKVVGGDGHHGGAWKVAYADFVTAMMAFFLLMWLLNATTESQRKGIADYFAPSIPLSPVSGGGDGVLSGDSPLAQETLSESGSGGEAHEAGEDGAEASPGADVEPGEGETEVQGVETDPDAPLADLESALAAHSGESEVADDLLQHIVTRVTDEGLVIDVFAREGRPLFEGGSAEPTPKMRAILDMVAEVMALVTNRVEITGHTDAAPFTTGGDNWGLSAARADATRRALAEAGVAPARMARIAGKADRDLALPDAPLDPRNRRVTITLLRSDR